MLIFVSKTFAGGIELVLLVIFAFLFFNRSKFFYYLSAFSFDKLITSLLKNLYLKPRPYMEN